VHLSSGSSPRNLGLTPPDLFRGSRQNRSQLGYGMFWSKRGGPPPTGRRRFVEIARSDQPFSQVNASLLANDLPYFSDGARHPPCKLNRRTSLLYLSRSIYLLGYALASMAGQNPYFQQPQSSPSLPLPPPPPPQAGNPPNAVAYGYSYDFRYPSSTIRLTPGQAPRQSAAPPFDARNVVEAPLEADGGKGFYCEPCDLELDSALALKSHCKSHVKCTECSFEGAPKIVKAHYQGLHGKFSGSGFKTVTVTVPGCRVQRFRICVGNRPEDIQRWIEERKKRFPRQRKDQSDENAPSIGEARKDLPPGGMSSLLAGYGSSGSESEDDSDAVKPAVERLDGNPTLSNPLSTKNDDTPCEKTTTSLAAPPQQETVSSAVTRISRPCRYFLRNGSCMNGDACRFSHDTVRKILPTQPSDRDMKRRRGRHTTSDTLLRKLLVSDMQRESALAMQLLEYIVDKDFFGCDG
jgi:Zinc finger domain/Nuclear fragile X mental retardation-interacting protein 1 (NUFIP1)